MGPLLAYRFLPRALGLQSVIEAGLCIESCSGDVSRLSSHHGRQVLLRQPSLPLSPSREMWARTRATVVVAAAACTFVFIFSAAEAGLGSQGKCIQPFHSALASTEEASGPLVLAGARSLDTSTGFLVSQVTTGYEVNWDKGLEGLVALNATAVAADGSKPGWHTGPTAEGALAFGSDAAGRSVGTASNGRVAYTRRGEAANNASLVMLDTATGSPIGEPQLLPACDTGGRDYPLVNCTAVILDVEGASAATSNLLVAAWYTDVDASVLGVHAGYTVMVFSTAAHVTSSQSPYHFRWGNDASGQFIFQPHFAVSPNGDVLYILDQGTVSARDASTGAERHSFSLIDGLTARANAFSITPDGNYVVALPLILSPSATQATVAIAAADGSGAAQSYTLPAVNSVPFTTPLDRSWLTWLPQTEDSAASSEGGSNTARIVTAMAVFDVSFDGGSASLVASTALDEGNEPVGDDAILGAAMGSDGSAFVWTALSVWQIAANGSFVRTSSDASTLFPASESPDLGSTGTIDIQNGVLYFTYSTGMRAVFTACIAPTVAQTIAGYVVGGVVFVCCLAACAVFLFKRNNNTVQGPVMYGQLDAQGSVQGSGIAGTQSMAPAVPSYGASGPSSYAPPSGNAGYAPAQQSAGYTPASGLAPKPQDGYTPATGY